MKKLISLLLVILLAIFMFSCGEKNKDSKEDIGTQTTTEDNSKNEVTSSEKSNKFNVVFPKVEEQVIYDENNIRIIVKAGEISGTGVNNAKIPLVIENNSTSSINVKMGNFKINGLTLYFRDSLFYKGDISAGESVEADIHLIDQVFELLQIKEIGDIILDLEIDSESEDKTFEKKNVEIITSLTGKVNQELNKEGIELINQDGIQLIVREQLFETSMGPALEYYFENNLDTYVRIENEGEYLTINGLEVNSPFILLLEPNSKTILRETILEYKISEAGVELPINSILFKLTAEEGEYIGDTIIEPFDVKLDF